MDINNEHRGYNILILNIVSGMGTKGVFDCPLFPWKPLKISYAPSLVVFDCKIWQGINFQFPCTTFGLVVTFYMYKLNTPLHPVFVFNGKFIHLKRLQGIVSFLGKQIKHAPNCSNSPFNSDSILLEG